MIEWFLLGFNALWITGLSLVAAALSFTNYLGGRKKLGFMQAIKTPVCRIMIDLGLVFFCLGRVGGLSAIWERLLWGALAFFFFVLKTWHAWKINNP
jgi:hypothetical protein